MQLVSLSLISLSKNQGHCVRAYRSGLLHGSASGLPDCKLGFCFLKTSKWKYLVKGIRNKFSYIFDVVKGSFITEIFSKSKEKDNRVSISIAIYLH